MVRVPHRKVVCHVSHPLPTPTRASGQRSPPPPRTPLRTRWDQLPPANRQRLLHLLGRLVDRHLSPVTARLPAGREEATHDLPHEIVEIVEIVPRGRAPEPGAE